jgi:hypothetical protein
MLIKPTGILFHAHRLNRLDVDLAGRQNQVLIAPSPIQKDGLSQKA